METGITLERALELIRLHTAPLSPVELAGNWLQDHVLAQDVIAPMDQPPFDRSPLDGYALRAEDSLGASPDHPVLLEVRETLCAGDWPQIPLNPGQCARIMTGAPIPPGADCVIRQEDTDRAHPRVGIFRALAPHENYCFAGEDFQNGSLLFPAGTRMDSFALGVLASAGLWETPLSAHPRPKVLLAGTGDELAQPGDTLRPGQIYNSNLPQLAARCRQLGLEAATAWWPDDPRAVAEALSESAGLFDCVITTGGVSVGDKDIFHQALPLADAQRLFWRVQLKPGTPLMFSLIQGKPVLSLSGNPFAAAATFELLGRPLLSALEGQPHWQPIRLSAPLATPFPKASGGRRFVRGVLRDGSISLPDGHSSGQLRSQVGCNCLVDIPAGSPALEAGTMVKAVLL